ncbi:hypothetical protein HUU90_14125 [Burkholderia glumae]|nr:hypothetical protein [Burkholderia glumae]NVE23588.1 hypothetical protein [Burkholderia glumae]
MGKPILDAEPRARIAPLLPPPKPRRFGYPDRKPVVDDLRAESMPLRHPGSRRLVRLAQDPGHLPLREPPLVHDFLSALKAILSSANRSETGRAGQLPRLHGADKDYTTINKELARFGKRTKRRRECAAPRHRSGGLKVQTKLFSGGPFADKK